MNAWLCRQWLQELSLALTAAQETSSLLQNPLRNGVLLCDLAGKGPGKALACHTLSNGPI